jgi:putative ABC transport system substrate-binding protein
VAFAAKAATTKIPIVFTVGEDPVKLGLVTSLARPVGNLTGINFLVGELTAKRLELHASWCPPPRVSPSWSTRPMLRRPNLHCETLNRLPAPGAWRSRSSKLAPADQIDAAFATFVREPPDAIFVGNDAFFNARRVQLALLAGRHGVPAIYSDREYAEAGGLMSYGSDIKDAYRQVGIYVGRLLKGAKPADLPIVQSTKFELVINHQTARMLGITVPQTLLTSADEVIE